VILVVLKNFLDFPEKRKLKGKYFTSKFESFLNKKKIKRENETEKRGGKERTKMELGSLQDGCHDSSK